MEDGYSLFDLDEKRTPLPGMDLLGYSFSPDGDQVVYSCAGTYKYSSLCLADISISGITNERKTAEDVLLDAFGESMWSKDERYVGFFAVLNGTKSFRAVDVSTGAIAYEWPYPSKTVLVGWSPSGDKIIDYDGFILDLNTGQTSNLFQGNPTPYGVMDWRSIKIP